MKVLHVIPTLSATAGGPTEVALNVARCLNQKGVEVEILTTDDNGNDRFAVPPKELTTFQGLPVRFFPRINPRLKEFIISPSAFFWMRKNLRNYDILDIHYLFSFVPLIARSIARNNKIPYTVRTMGQLSPWALEQSKLKKKLFFALQEYENLCYADAIHSTSKGEESDIRTFGLKNEVINIPLGVTKPALIQGADKIVRKKLNIDKDSFIVLFLARLHYKKRPEVVIKAISELSRNHKVHLIIAGSGEEEYTNKLKDLTTVCSITAQVSFTGFVEGKDKDMILQAADIFVLPSFSENFAIAVAESLAAGTPVIITPEVQISEYVEEYNAGIISSGTEEAFMGAIKKCIENRDMLDNYRNNGLKLVNEKFDWNIITDELILNYERIIKNKRDKNDKF